MYIRCLADIRHFSPISFSSVAYPLSVAAAAAAET